MAAGDGDFSENHNEWINPGETLWKWKTVTEAVRESLANHM